MNILRYPFAHPLRTVGLVVPATILGALAIEKAGYPPCTLCLYQRVPYYVLCALLLTILPLADSPSARRLRRPFLLLVLAVLLVSAALGVFHAGVEFALWEGPHGCSGALDSTNIDNLLASLKETKVVSCTKASFWVFGLSLSVWNAIISTGLAALVGTAVLKKQDSVA
ncbi:disulfide bond formation protein B [Pararhizobium sp. BT-229]|uniref:disulfide bond formation protein B n=1 Tax=Pararhizobium sp. BT-229 TaxID=2986923 RepID=UPI0021F6B9B8|nr:disulfide bond formation protein B [Pararhizobium sp. BT-229]MCV9964021.1 disulfide bond formation protein B [Pararhizobium sp. BT-229]